MQRAQFEVTSPGEVLALILGYAPFATLGFLALRFLGGRVGSAPLRLRASALDSESLNVVWRTIVGVMTYLGLSV